MKSKLMMLGFVLFCFCATAWAQSDRGKRQISPPPPETRFVELALSKGCERSFFIGRFYPVILPITEKMTGNSQPLWSGLATGTGTLHHPASIRRPASAPESSIAISRRGKKYILIWHCGIIGYRLVSVFRNGYNNCYNNSR